MEEKNYKVYIHRNKINNKVYIGITSKKPEERWKNGHAYHGNKYFTSAIKKYGWDNFEHEILFENLTKEEAEQKEVELIAKYNSANREFGYNIQNGGSSNGRFTEETKEKIRQSTFAYFATHDNPMQGKTVSEESKKRNMLSQPNRKVVEQIDLKTGEVINEFPAISKAANLIGCSASDISKCCNGEYSQTHGYGWRFKDNPIEYVPKNKNWHPVAQIDIETNEVIKIYNCISEAEKELGIKNISAVCCGYARHKTSGGYKWKYVEDIQ